MEDRFGYGAIVRAMRPEEREEMLGLLLEVGGFSMPRPARRRGGDEAAADVSSDKVSVLTMVNARGDAMAVAACRGKMGVADARRAMAGCALEGAVVSTDRQRGYVRAPAEMGVAAHERFASSGPRAPLNRVNELWATDITEFRLPCGAKCYLSPVIDCFDGRPVAWSIGRRPTARLANSSLEAACGTLAPGEAPAVHSDRSGHYRWPRWWIVICEANGLAKSMSRKGMSCDNARAEGFFGLLKQEFLYSRDWEGVGVAGFMAELDAWMSWFRSGRISEALG